MPVEKAHIADKFISNKKFADKKKVAVYSIFSPFFVTGLELINH